MAQFLTHLATERQVSSSTQNQALNALVFLYRQVLGRPLGDIQGAARAKQPIRVPVVLTAEEVGRVLGQLSGVHWLVACLQYGSGLRLMESVRLRVKDLDFAHRAVFVRDGKGGKDRVVTLPDELVEPLQRHLEARHSSGTAPTVWAASICRTRSPGSTRTRRRSGAGSTCFPPATSPWIRARVHVAATTWMRAPSRRPCAARCALGA